MSWWDSPRTVVKRKKKQKLGPRFQCNCGAVVPVAHWDGHLRKGDHAAKVARHTEMLERVSRMRVKRWSR